MNKLTLTLNTFKNTSGQDLLEYALVAGFLALTVAAILPGAASGISSIFSEVGAAMPAAQIDSTQVSVSTN